MKENEQKQNSAKEIKPKSNYCKMKPKIAFTNEKHSPIILSIKEFSSF